MTTTTYHQRGEAMMTQTVLPFKLEVTNETITAHAGLVVFGEFVHGLGLNALVNRNLPKPGSGAGYAPSAFVEPLILMLHGGGRSLEDLRVIYSDKGLREVLKMESTPSTDAVGDWLRRMGLGAGLSGLGRVNREIIRRALKKDKRALYTLDIDATQVVAAKRDAKVTYKGEQGYMPIVGHLAENGIVLCDEFREGNETPGARNLEFIKDCAAELPAGKRIGFFRADSASYQADIFNYCEKKGVKFAIGGDKDEAVKRLIGSIPESDWRPFRDGHIAETVHSMNKTENSFRLVVIRRPVQQGLFSGSEEQSRYTVIASNREETAEDTVAWYNRRGETSENRIKELKIGFGMERMPCGDFGANAVFFRIGVLAYNLYKFFQAACLPESWRTHQVQTVRWRLYGLAGKVVRHAREVILKVRRGGYGVMREIRHRSYEFCYG